MLKRIKGLINRKISNKAYITTINVAASICNNETFKAFKNCNMGRKIALCGAGPSLNDYIPIEDCIHVALNRALLNERIKYDYFIGDDWDGIDFFQDELLDFKGIKFFGHQIGTYKREIPESFSIKCNAKRYYTDTYIFGDGFDSRFVADIDKMAIGNMPNIALSAMQILLFTNPKIIYLVGCDASKGHYVQPKKLTKERIETHEKDLAIAVSANKTIKKWLELKEFANAFYPDTKIVSINPVGLKGIFEDEYQK
ncbi:MAG: hypothetical protein IKF80_09655 [Erysipelotrichaceae bacterium]|nr:hypothetical protein [Erysipelotrichaceae bacterium]